MPIVAPNSDVVTTGWASTPPGDFFDAIDEASANEADYISTPVAGATPAIFGLAQPVDAGQQTVRVRAAVTTGTATLKVALLDSSNVVQGESATTEITTTPTQYDLTLTTTGTATRVRIEIGGDPVTYMLQGYVEPGYVV